MVAIFSRVLAGGGACAQGSAAHAMGGLLHVTGSAAHAMGGLAPMRLDSGMVRFFSGEWTGAGTFANGRAIAAKLSFRLTLDSAWLVCEHRDDPPGQYAATLYWGVDRATGQFLAYAFDNFQGHRVFTGNATGRNNVWRLVLTDQAFAPGVGTYYEHFIYQQLSATQFKMSYETSLDAITWSLGDSVIFNKRMD
jgi:hypothetical protein